jgi:hypothetical protein
MESQISTMLAARDGQRSWIATLTDSQISSLDGAELLEVIQAYQGPSEIRAEEDHRRYLSRSELERLVYLARGHCRRACGCQ